MITRQRFDLALRELQSGKWERFEQLASAFLAGDFDDLRTTASPSGDRGRDAQLFTSGEPTTLVQYSVARDWKAKIRKTVDRISGEFPKASLLVYVTNQEIGSEADDIVRKLRQENRLILDIRDRSWFLDRMHRDRAREIVAEELAKEVVDPLLASRELIERRPSPLSSIEMRAAVVHLELQWANEERAKGLTKTTYEAIVRSVLRDTSSENRLTREDVQAQVHALLPSRDADAVNRHTNRALDKLSSKAGGHRLIRHWQQEDEFCLTHAERVRFDEHMIRADSLENRLQIELHDMVKQHAANYTAGPQLDEQEVTHLQMRCRRVLEQFLLSRGEAFVAAVKTGKFEDLNFQDLRELIVKDFDTEKYDGPAPAILVVEIVVLEVIVQPGIATQKYLRNLVDAYTLLAFLQETTDVQKAIKALFSHGEVWLDTNILLPLFVERLMEEEGRQYSSLIVAAHEAGLKLNITEGVLEELERHMNRCLLFAKWRGNWDGSVPFLYAVYASLGGIRGGFKFWIQEFMGQERPEDDLAEFLDDEFGIKVHPLSQEASTLPDELRQEVQAEWIETHELRRGRKQNQEYYDDIRINRLAEHDSDNYLGVIARRIGTSKKSPFGYSSWWLTLDRAAFRLEERLRQRLIGSVPPSPVMSPDFLTHYLAFGPLRGKVPKKRSLTLPIALVHVSGSL